MLEVTRKAAALLKAAKAAEGASPESAIRIRSGKISNDSGRDELAVGFTVAEEPSPGDETIEQDGLLIFVEDRLVESLDGRTLDVWNEGDEGPELVFR
jgi:Fe-S cluster assembly iron-binding protein IscA